MADYKKLATEIIAAVGGEENITKVIHCITRLRFYLVDKEKADDKKLEAMDGVAGVVYNANLGQYQVVIGQAVEDVYDEIVAQLGSRVVDGESSEEVEETKVSKNPIIRAFQVVVGTITGSMMPIIGLLAAGGMINGILNMFVKGNHIFELISPTDPTYIIISTMAMAPFYFLPVLVGYAAAKQLGSDPFVVAAVGGFMIHPALQGLVAAPNVIEKGEIVAGKAPVVMELFGVTFNTSYFNIPVSLPNYAYTIFPIIVAAWMAKPIGAWLKKHMPLALRSIFVPMITFFVVASLVLLLVGPVISIVSSALASVITGLINLNLTIAGAIIGGLYQVLVIFGLHWLVIPILTQQIVTTGESNINMIVSFTMLAQGAGALAVFLKTRQQSLKGLALPAAISAFCGVTEPAMYGINLKYIRVFIMSSIGAAAGAAVAGLFDLHMYGFSGSLIGFPNFAATTNPLTHAAGNPNNFIYFCIATAVCIVVSMTLVWFFGFKDSDTMGTGLEKKNVFKSAVNK